MSYSKLFESGASTRNKSHFATLVSLAQSSGEIHPDQEKALIRFKSILDISDSSYEAILKNPALYPVTPPNDTEERIAWLHDLFKIVFADRHLHEEEHRLLRKYARALGYNEEDAAYLVARSIEIFSGSLNLEDYRYLLNKNR